jgi:hypothetical protein
MADRLVDFWTRFRHCFWAETRDQSTNAYHYLSALLRMTEKRNCTGPERATG